MKILIGNIQPNTEIKIKFVYSQELGTFQNKYYLYKIPSTITARYTPPKFNLEKDFTVDNNEED